MAVIEIQLLFDSYVSLLLGKTWKHVRKEAFRIVKPVYIASAAAGVRRLSVNVVSANATTRAANVLTRADS